MIAALPPPELLLKERRRHLRAEGHAPQPVGLICSGNSALSAVTRTRPYATSNSAFLRHLSGILRTAPCFRLRSLSSWMGGNPRTCPGRPVRTEATVVGNGWASARGATIGRVRRRAADDGTTAFTRQRFHQSPRLPAKSAALAFLLPYLLHRAVVATYTPSKKPDADAFL